MKIVVINGPSLKQLGKREVDVLGRRDYDYLCQTIMKQAAKDNVIVELYQSNHEGDLIDKIHACSEDKTCGIIINPGAYSHYSYSIYDALRSVDYVKVEVHIADMYERDESWRHSSVTADACDKLIMGKGFEGYIEALHYIMEEAGKRGIDA
ncbi:MAG: 3-dehydroquinate dehydratase [Lachnospiraceae bacterium]|nr:3-dehydroquinate dehydratase [Lachnospiraceae bacterium]